MGALLAFGFLFWLRRPAAATQRRTRLRRYLAGVAVTITAITILYTVATLRFQDLSTTVRYSRQLYVWLIVLAAPQFIRTRRNVERVAAFLAAYAGFSAVLYVAQAVTPPQTVLRYSQQLITGGQTRVWATSLSAIYVGGLAIFAYQLRTRHSRGMLWVCFSACSLAIVMSQGRMLTGVFAVSIAAMLLHRAIVTHRIGLAVRVAATAAVLILVCTAILWSANRLDPLLDAWNHRLGELEVDVKAHEGSWTSRSAMFQYLPLVVERNGGGLLASCFGMGFRALTPADLAPMTFWGVISPPIWADNGLAGVTFTFGYFGLGLFFLFVATMVWRLAAQFTRAGDPLSRSITLTAMLYFTFILPYMFFSAAFMGVWDDALAVVVMLIMAERSAALRPRRAFAA
ncbi:MAG TPA: hypothetical protein VGR95_06010 [Thermoanaerobaculia bacterium]|nr:hypothetical protein [Thermoanaerobaculia bacterium]